MRALYWQNANASTVIVWQFHYAKMAMISLAMSRQARPKAYTVVQSEIGNRIRWARELVQPNQAIAAQWLGIEPSTLNKIEKGSRPPNIFNVIAFANRFHLSADYVLRGVFTGKENQDLALRLAAEHPELILGKGGQNRDKDTFQAFGKVLAE